jgi:ribosomal protein S7
MPDYNEKIISLIEEAKNEAYSRGYNDAISAMNAAVTAVSPKVRIIDPASIGPYREAPVSSRPRGRPATAINLVKTIIGESPGLKGAEIVRALGSHGTPILDRTMRSCLRRLKASGEVRQRSKRWYPVSKDKVETNKFGEVPRTPPQ